MLNLYKVYMSVQWIDSVFLLLYWLIIARAFLNAAPTFRMKHFQGSRIVYRITDPFMIPIENFMYKHARLDQVDLSPLLAIIMLQLLKTILYNIIY